MSSNNDKTEKSLAEFVGIIVLVAILMGVFIHYFFKQEAQISETAFKALAQKFNVKVATIHAQWMMDKQPNVVKLQSLNSKKKQWIVVNEKGWVDVTNKSSVCEAIWQTVMESPLSLMKQSISAIEVRNVVHQSVYEIHSTCRFVLPNGAYFEYDRQVGRVSSVINESQRD